MRVGPEYPEWLDGCDSTWDAYQAGWADALRSVTTIQEQFPLVEEPKLRLVEDPW